MISDNKEVLIAFHEKGAANDEDAKKKFKTSALWTTTVPSLKSGNVIFQIAELNRLISRILVFLPIFC